MEKNEHALTRLSELMTLLMSSGCGNGQGREKFSVEKLSSRMGLPLSVLYKDLLCLCKDKTVKNAFMIGDADGTASEAEQETRTDEWLRSLKLKEKKAFTEKISIDPDILTGGD